MWKGQQDEQIKFESRSDVWVRHDNHVFNYEVVVMKMTGKLKSVQMDWMSRKWNVTFELNEKPSEQINVIATYDNLNIDVKKFRKRRSLDANAYAWVLMQKLAEATDSDRNTVYLEMLKKYSREFTFVICKEKALDKLKELYRTCVDLGEVKVNGMEGHQIQVFFGSSTFDSKAMAVLINGIVSECKELGIETAPPEDVERMVNEWGK